MGLKRLRIAGLAAIAMLIAAGPPVDLDVGLPTGSPFDHFKIPAESPTVGNPARGTASEPGTRPAGSGRGETVAEDRNKKPPPRPPTGLPGVTAPTTVDYQQHLNWNPKDDLVEWKDPKAPPTPTGPAAPQKDPEKWDLSAYPPKIPNDLYVYAITRYLMVLVHPAQVNERELIQFLIEVGFPSHYAASACRAESRLKRMTGGVMEAVGPMISNPPAKPADKVAQKVYMDLLLRYAYEPEFGSWILAQPTGDTLPVLLDIVKNQRHPLLLRNAVFILRCYDSTEVIAPLRAQMKSGDRVVRNRAIAALVRWKDEEAAEWLGKQLGSSEVSFRTYAAWAIGRIGAPASTAALTDAVRRNVVDAEFLWTAIPALGLIGESATPDRKKRIEETLLILERSAPLIKDPDHWDGTGNYAPAVPDPAGSYSKIIGQRIRFALARIGRAAEVDLVKNFKGADLLEPNRELLTETQEAIYRREKKP